MYVFRRSVTVNPQAALEARTFAVEIAQLASGIAERPITAFEVAFGGPAGTLAWSMPINDFADLDAIQQRLLGDAGYLAAALAGAPFFADNVHDHVIQLIASGISASDSAMYSGLEAVARPTATADAMAFGVKAQEFMQHAGFETAFGASPFGTIGSCGWLVSLGSMADLDRLQAFVTTDPGYAEMSAAAADLFEPMSGVRTLVRRLG